jgi:uncharacterized spore protein YtfJ
MTGESDTSSGNAQTPAAARLVEQARTLLTVERVYGTPVERDGVTVIPAAAVRGGGGGGGGAGQDDKGASGRGEGLGFGVTARPVGAFVVRDGQVRWEPAVDVTRIVLTGQLVALMLVMTIRAVAKLRAKRR